MKIPKDIPTKVGDRVRHRGRVPERIGTVLSLVRQPSWMWVRWDNRPPMLCHQNELQLLPDIPETGEQWFRDAKLRLPGEP